MSGKKKLIGCGGGWVTKGCSLMLLVISTVGIYVISVHVLKDYGVRLHVLEQPASQWKNKALRSSTAGPIGIPARVALHQETANRVRLQQFRTTCDMNSSHYITTGRRKFGIHRNRSDKYDMLDTALRGETPVRVYHVLRNLVKVVFVRDLYERIFSAYVDRVFGVTETFYSLYPAILEKPHMNLTERHSCHSVTDITFSDVIRYVIRTPVTDLDEHFSLYYSICFPCHLDYDYVGKLETFRHDLRVLLTSVGVDPHSVLGDDDVFDAHNDVNIIHDVIERTFEMLEFFFYRNCFKKHRMLRRTWVSFQVRGFLPLEMTFPLTHKEAEDVTLTQFGDLVKDTYLKVTNRSHLKGQRQLAMKEAYYSLPRDLLSQLQTVVQGDCDLFGYECSVDARFNEHERPVSYFHFDQL